MRLVFLDFVLGETVLQHVPLATKVFVLHICFCLPLLPYRLPDWLHA